MARAVSARCDANSLAPNKRVQDNLPEGCLAADKPPAAVRSFGRWERRHTAAADKPPAAPAHSFGRQERRHTAAAVPARTCPSRVPGPGHLEHRSTSARLVVRPEVGQPAIAILARRRVALVRLAQRRTAKVPRLKGVAKRSNGRLASARAGRLAGLRLEGVVPHRHSRAAR